MPCGFEVMYRRKVERVAKNCFKKQDRPSLTNRVNQNTHSSLTDVLGQMCSERRSSAAVSGI
jgi:hypothetical protein